MEGRGTKEVYIGIRIAIEIEAPWGWDMVNVRCAAGRKKIPA